MKREERLALLHRVARLYYQEGKKKYAIAHDIGQSPTQVGNLLDEAKAEGIVKIEIGLPQFKQLQDKLKKKHSLKDAVVVPYDTDCSVLLRTLGQAAAEYFQAHVSDGQRVALGGGYLMYRMVSDLREEKRDIHIYPAAIIGRGPDITHIDPQIVVTLLWAKSGLLPGHAHYVTVTPVAEGSVPELRRHYKKVSTHPTVARLLKEMNNVDWLFASIGGVAADPSYVAATNYATKNLLNEIDIDDEKLKEQGLVGDIVYSFFDKKGKTRAEWQIVPSVGDLNRLASDSSKNVVVVVGSYKMEALQAVLTGDLCNILITDTRAAEQLLQ